MTKIKICGVTNLANALAIAELKVDAIGFNFYHKSIRKIDNKTAALISQELPPFITKVGLFVNHNANEINTILQSVALDVLQFHGDESVEFCESFGYSYIKAIGVDNSTNIAQLSKNYHSAAALLFDTKSIKFGGSGKVFNWKLLPKNLTQPIILAGGINTANVKQAISAVKPYAIDVASGVEDSQGLKDIAKIKQIIQIINNS